MTSPSIILRTLRVLVALTGLFLFQETTLASTVSGQVSSSGQLSPSKVKSGATFKGTATTEKSFKVIFSVPSIRGAKVRDWQVTGAIPSGLKVSAGVKKSGSIVAKSTRLTFSGKPSKGGAYTLSLTATYTNGRTATATYSLAIKEPVKITKQPSSTSVFTGDTATLEVKTSGFPQPTYQWYKGSTKISGKTSAKLTLSNATTATAGKYHVVATNSSGSVKSSSATVTVLSSSSGGWGGVIVVTPSYSYSSGSSSAISSGSLTLSNGAMLQSNLGLSSSILTGTTGLLVNSQPVIFQAMVPDQTRPIGPWNLSGFTFLSPDLPAWLSLDSATGVLTGNPLLADMGTYSVTIGATAPESTLTILLDIVVE